MLPLRTGLAAIPDEHPAMKYPTGIHARIMLKDADGGMTPLELAIGPADSLGNLENVAERFAEAYCLDRGYMGCEVTQIRLCLFDPEHMVVGFDADDDGRPDPNDAMGKRFCFVFMKQMDDEPSVLDPWLVVRPCTREQVVVWEELMGLTGPGAVHTWCLDDRLSGLFAAEE
jgi:hypothetical protein